MCGGLSYWSLLCSSLGFWNLQYVLFTAAVFNASSVALAAFTSRVLLEKDESLHRVVVLVRVLMFVSVPYCYWSLYLSLSLCLSIPLSSFFFPRTHRPLFVFFSLLVSTDYLHYLIFIFASFFFFLAAVRVTPSYRCCYTRVSFTHTNELCRKCTIFYSFEHSWILFSFF